VGQAGKPHSGCSQNLAGRGQILLVLQVNSRSIDQKSGEICTVQADLQPIYFKSDRLLAHTSPFLRKQKFNPRKRNDLSDTLDFIVGYGRNIT